MTTGSWEFRCGELANFYETHGHSRVPQKDEKGKLTNLGSWVSEQRRRKQTLSEERVSRLDALDFVWDPLKMAWEEKFSELENFVAEHGHARVPRKDETGKYSSLGHWVASQREAKESLSAEQVGRLDTLDFIPMATVDYSGGTIVSDWYTDGSQKNEAIKNKQLRRS